MTLLQYSNLKGLWMATTHEKTGLELYRMARKKKPGDGPGTPVRIDSDLVAKARYLAAHVGLELSAYISQLLRPLIVREFKKAGRELMGESEEK
jgi:hypothetical protein